MNDLEPPIAPLDTVLIIDDELFDQKMYQRIISRSGLVRHTLSFQFAQDALDYLKDSSNQKVDVIFLDINMPRMNGFEFLEAATAEHGPNFATLCVVMLTTSLTKSDQRRAAQFPIVKEYLNKPLTTDDMAHVARLVQNI